MSGGIFGIVGDRGQSVDWEALEAMSDALKTRGPDGGSLWHAEGVGFGCRSLFATPEAPKEILPRYDAETGLCITADARLDDREGLIGAIGRSAFRGPVITDSDLLLQAFIKWQADCVRHLLGDFAFVVWDARKRELFCARDHLGVKPFYYYHQGRGLIFCSESWVIALHAGVPATLNEARIADFLTPHLEGYDKTSTFYREISRLPPAHTLTFRDGRLTIKRYWEPTPKAVWHASDDDYIEALNALLTQAIGERCRGSKPALLLSGGIDSAAVAGIGGRLLGGSEDGPLHTYSGVAKAPDCKESCMVRAMATAFGTQPHHYTVDDLAADLDDLFPVVGTIQEPFDFMMIMHLYLYRKAASHGHRFILDGVDGDISASLSLSYPAWLFRCGKIRTGLVQTFFQSRGYLRDFYSFPGLLYQYLRSAYTPEAVRRIVRYLRDKWAAKRVEHTYGVNDTFARRIGLADRLKTFGQYGSNWQRRSHIDHYIERIMHPFLTVGIERYDRVASICSIEARHPLIDKRIIDFYLSLPWQQFVRDGWSKHLLRKVAEQTVPQEVCWRTGKEHLGYSFTSTLMQKRKRELFSLITANYDFVTRILAFSPDETYNDGNGFSQSEAMMHGSALALWLNSGKGIQQRNAQKSRQTPAPQSPLHKTDPDHSRSGNRPDHRR